MRCKNLIKLNLSASINSQETMTFLLVYTGIICLDRTLLGICLARLTRAGRRNRDFKLKKLETRRLKLLQSLDYNICLYLRGGGKKFRTGN